MGIGTLVNLSIFIASLSAVKVQPHLMMSTSWFEMERVPLRRSRSVSSRLHFNSLRQIEPKSR